MTDHASSTSYVQNLTKLHVVVHLLLIRNVLLISTLTYIRRILL